MRTDGRAADALRNVTMERDVMKNALGSCYVKFGDTHVLCAATIEERVALWRRNSGKGWVTAEYSMLPAATSKRTSRETNGLKGRTQEIQRLIGRSLRTVVDMKAMGEITLTVDCDVIQADGGTRTAAITGAWVAIHDALMTWVDAAKIPRLPIRDQVAAISVGMVDGAMLLDLDYPEDSRAEVDMNIVMNGSGEFIEVQGTGEQTPFSRDRLNALLDMGAQGIEELLAAQRRAIGEDDE